MPYNQKRQKHKHKDSLMLESNQLNKLRVYAFLQCEDE